MPPILSAALWALLGAVVPAALKLAGELWGTTPAQGPARKLAWATFIITLVAGPGAAAAFEWTFAPMFPLLKPSALSFVIGVGGFKFYPLYARLVAPGLAAAAGPSSPSSPGAPSA